MAKILLVEDEEVVVRMYKKLLENHGHSVTVANNGEIGLKSALDGHPNLILLDIRMPKMDGITMMHKLREDTWGKTASIIVLTNLDVNDERLSAVVTDQPSCYLIKANNPPEQVLEKVEEVLEGKKEE